MLLCAQWEDKAEGHNIHDAIFDLQAKTAAWTPLYYGKAQVRTPDKACVVVCYETVLSSKGSQNIGLCAFPTRAVTFLRTSFVGISTTTSQNGLRMSRLPDMSS